MEGLALVARVVFSLVVVLVVMWFAVRAMRKGQARTVGGVQVDVLARQQLAQRASVAVVQVGDRALVLGVTDGRIDLLSEVALCDLVGPGERLVGAPVLVGHVEDARGAGTTALRTRSSTRTGARTQQRLRTRAAAPSGRLAGSALSPQTWTKALDAVRQLTVRR
ncbi:MAG TPA: flagellar biosynthetic protein FliO [Actinomycetales bacterium]